MPEPVRVAEAKIEAALCKAVAERGGLAVKLAFPGMRGAPDRLVILPGCPPFFAELKRPNGRGRVSPHQWWWIRRLQALGVAVEVVRNLGDIDRVLKSRAACATGVPQAAVSDKTTHRHTPETGGSEVMGK